MKIIRGTKEFKLNNTAVTLGKFDGMHKGHMSLVNQVVSCGGSGLVPVLFTFDTSPNEVVSQNKMKYIIDSDEKYEICRKSGIDTVIEYPFDQDTMHMDAEEFIEKIIIKQLDAKKVAVGKDFNFGRDRKGNVSLLKSMAGSYELIVKDKVLYGTNEISSTYIRQCIQNGEIEKANYMLGREYSISGEIIYGKMLGRTIGVPTINMGVRGDKVLPPFGVYATITQIDGTEYKGITNIGNNPTVSADNSIKVETHLFECSRELYGMTARVRFYRFIRSEKKFSGVDELRRNMQHDIKTVKTFFNHCLDTD